jgi:hypothetical protein
VHKPSLKEEEGRGESEVVRLNQKFSHPSLDPMCPILPCVRPSDVV